MTKSELFKSAHKIARKTVLEVGNYMIAFSLALKEGYAKMKTESEISIKDKIIALGGKEWKKDSMHRVYISCAILNILREEKDLGTVNFGASNNKIFFDVTQNAVMRSYKNKKPNIEIAY